MDPSLLTHYGVIDHYGIDRLGLGEWQACQYFDRHYLPPTRSVYLLMDECYCSDPDDDLLYVGIAPESLRSRWVTPSLRGESGHHVLDRLFNHDPVECVEAMEDDTYIVFCELPDMPLAELERVEECLIDLLIPRLNRQKSPLHPYKTVFKQLREFAAGAGWPKHYYDWPPVAMEFYLAIHKHMTAFRSTQMEQAPHWMAGLRGRWNYRAVVPGFDFLPREWRANMRYCPTFIIRKHLLEAVGKL